MVARVLAAGVGRVKQRAWIGAERAAWCGALPQDAALTDPDRDLFDEAGYLRRNPGLVDAIAAGIVDSGWDHFDKHGRLEGRLPNDVDPDFYLGAYPIAAFDLGRAPHRGDAAAHFLRFGRARGYLPNAQAPRREDPGAVGWTDRPDALDGVQNRLDLGRITDKQAERLRTWARDGFVVFDLGTATDRFAPAAMALEQTFAGVMPGALFRCPALGADPMAWVPELTPHPAAALDIHYVSQAVRSLILAPMVVRFLTEVFDSPLRITASEGVLRPIARPPHRDSGRFVGLWFGLDDVPTGEAMHVYPGSHRRPKLVREPLVREPLAPKPGSVVVWHPDTVWETASLIGLDVRRGIRTWIGPRTATPLYAETVPALLRVHDGHLFSAAAYPDREPLD